MSAKWTDRVRKLLPPKGWRFRLWWPPEWWRRVALVACEFDFLAGSIGVAAAVAERVELLHVADRQPRLRRDPPPQAEFQRGVRVRIEESRRQARRVAPGARGRQYARTALGDGHDDGIEAE